MNRRSLVLSLFTWAFLLATQTIGLAQAPAPRDELLSLVPADAGFCLIVQNLREQVDKWKHSASIKGLLNSPIGQGLAAAPEVKRIAAIEKEMQKHFQVDWAVLRDDVLGDAVVLAYWPGPPGKPEQEQGLLLIRARDPKLLAQLVDRLNEEQTKNGELKSLTPLEHQGVKYQRRKDARSTHYVLVQDNLFAFTRKEHLLQGVIEARKRGKDTDKSVISQQVARAGADRALAILWINPRAFEPELNQQAQKNGPEGQLLRSFLAYWRPLDAIVFSVSDGDELEVRWAVQARTKELPSSIRRAFEQQAKSAELWNRFPASAVFSVAGQIDVGQLAESIGEFLTPENRKAALGSLQRAAGPAIGGLSIVKDVLPHIGPDWGLCIAAASDPKHFPHILAALAVKPGSGKVPVDRALYDGVRIFATLAIFLHNRNNADRPLQLKSVAQNNVDVSYLAGDQVFPPGVQPAWALKDGYLVFASSPDAMLRFRAAGQVKPAGNEAPILKVSPTELAKLLRENRQLVVDHLAEKNKIPNLVANLSLETALGVLDLFEQITLAQGSGNGQMIWIVRLRPRVR